jgi:hypothetical protein
MSCYVVAHSFRRAARLNLSSDNLIADIECHVFSSRVDSIHINDQPASRIIHSILQSHNRGAAGDFLNCTRSGDITPELTGRGNNLETIQVLDESRAIRAPVQ